MNVCCLIYVMRVTQCEGCEPVAHSSQGCEPVAHPKCACLCSMSLPHVLPSVMSAVAGRRGVARGAAPQPVGGQRAADAGLDAAGIRGGQQGRGGVLGQGPQDAR